MNKWKVFCNVNLSLKKDALKELEKIADVTYFPAKQETLLDNIANFDAYFASGFVEMNKEVLDNAKNLKVIASPGTGTDHIDVNETKKSPYWSYSISKDQKLVSLFPDMELINNRQALQKTYELNGAIYAAFTNWFLDSKQFIGNNTLAYFMPPEKSIDIDTEYDFKLAEMIISSSKK